MNEPRIAHEVPRFQFLFKTIEDDRSKSKAHCSAVGVTSTQNRMNEPRSVHEVPRFQLLFEAI